MLIQLLSITSLGQNLINNPGFELNSGNIVTREMNFNKVNNWDVFTPSPDYIGANNSLYPYWPRPASGQFYVMIASNNEDSPNTQKESIGQKISLLESVNYRISFKAVSWWNLSNVLEIYGLEDEPSLTNSIANNNYLDQYSPIYVSDTFIGDTVWHNMEGCFKTNKKVNYIILVVADKSMYISIDDVSIEREEPLINTQGILPVDTIICDNLLGVELNPIGLDSILNWSDGSKESTLFVDTSGLYYVTGLQNKCVYRDSIAIVFLESPKVELPKDTFICDDEYILVNAEITNSVANYQVWNTTETDLTITIDSSGLYWVEVGNECGMSKDSIIINHYFAPTLELGEPIQNCENKEIEIDAYREGIIDYLWSDGSISSSNIISNSNIGLTVSNNCGSSWDTLRINNSNCECKIFIPNAFTPTKDGINERFTLASNCLEISGILIVYNRWGEKIYETTDLINGWDGYYKDRIMQGTYVCLFDINLPNKGRKIMSSTFQLLR